MAINLADFLSDKPGKGFPSQRERFENAVSALEQGVEAGNIANVVLKDAKERVNRALGEAWEKHVLDPFFNSGQFASLPAEVRELEYDIGLAPQLHTVNSVRKKIAKAKIDHPAVTSMTEVLDAAAPLAEMSADLKGKVIKKVVKSDEDKQREKDDFVKKVASTKAMAQVKDMLEGITKDSYNDLVNFFFDRWTKYVDDFITQAPERAKPTAYNPEILIYPTAYHFYRNPRDGQINAEAYKACEIAVEHTVNTAAPKKRPDAENKLRAKAEKAAAEIRQGFIYKNLSKLAGIIDTKGNMTKAEVVGRSVDLGGMTGTLRFEFADGSMFTVVNKVVFKVSQYGTPFYQFPLTFHDVMMPDGEKMNMPSEKKMNTAFLEWEAEESRNHTPSP